MIYAFNARGDLLMLHRRRQPNQGLWSPFGGKLHSTEGESPFQCAARETLEEIGVKVTPDQFHLTGMVTEKGYEGTTHWLMFMMELKVVINQLPSAHPEGDFEFVPLKKVIERKIPDADRDVLWPLFCQHRGGFFSVRIHCLEDSKMTVEIEQSMKVS